LQIIRSAWRVWEWSDLRGETGGEPVLIIPEQGEVPRWMVLIVHRVRTERLQRLW
jgi:hypothetical protein